MIFIFIFCTLPAGAAFVDTDSTYYEETVNLLEALGIMEGNADGSFDATAGITRAGAAMAAARLKGYDGGNANTAIYFSDVPENSEAFAEISFLASAGIIGGDKNGKYFPQDILTYNEAAKLLVAVLGYDYYAEYKGGYPKGYVAVAYEKNIFGNVSIGDFNAITRGEFALAVKNCLNAKPADKIMVNGAVKVREKDETLLYDMFGVRKLTAQITDVGTTALYGESSIGKNYIAAGNDTYHTNGMNLKPLLGYTADIYYTDDRDLGNVCVYAAKTAGSNNVVTIYAQDIVSADMDGIVYSGSNDKNKTEALGRSIAFIYNGTAKPKYTKEDLRPDSGKIVLIDSDDDGITDVVSVTSYVNYFVKSASAYEKVIYDTYEMPPLDLSGDDTEITIEKDGKKAEFDEIKQDSIIMAAADAEKTIVTKQGKRIRAVDVDNAKNIHIIISTKTVSGEVTAVDESDGKFEVNGEMYGIAKNFPNGKVELGDKGVFRMDMNYELAGVTPMANLGTQYGFLLEAATKGGLSDTAEFKLVDIAGNEKIYKGAKKIKFDRRPGLLNGEKVVEALAGEGGSVQELIEYEVNEEGLISLINRAKDATAEGYDNANFSLDYINNKALYDGTYHYFDTKFAVNRENSTVFFISRNEGERYTAENVKIGSYTAFAHDNYYDLKGYEADEVGMMTIMVINKTFANSVDKQKSPIAVVDKIVSVLNSDGDEAYKCYAYVDGVRQGIVFGPDAKKADYEENYFKEYEFSGKIKSPADFRRGDIFQYDTDNKGEISVYAPLFLANEHNKSETLEMQTKQYKSFQTILGDAVCATSLFVRINYHNAVNDSDETRMVSIRNKKVVMYDKAADKLVIASPADIRTLEQTKDSGKPAKFFFKMYQGTVTGFYVIQ